MDMVGWGAPVDVGNGKRVRCVVSGRMRLAQRALIACVASALSIVTMNSRADVRTSAITTSAVSGSETGALAARRGDVAVFPFEVHSSDDGLISGEIVGRLAFPFAAVREALASPQAWCQMVTLHLNVKGCVYREEAAESRVTIYTGRKEFQPLDRSYALDYGFTAEVAEGGLEVKLTAARGPLGTKDYLIDVAFREISSAETQVEIAYRYSGSQRARINMNAYLATAGRHKVGFTVLDHDAQGHPQYIAGARGMMERNAMRYFLAIQAYLESLTIPANERLAWSTTRWFELTEQYPLQ
ncbi:MAG: hypothetical protein ACREXT_13820, partial [Gammaproteobacteria bacterium]